MTEQSGFGKGKVGLTFSNMGEFVSEGNWRHPERTLGHYELIAVTKGTVYLRVGGENRTLTAGDMICLKPGIPHGGWKDSRGVTFFWIHFAAKGFERFGFEQKRLPTAGTVAMFREMSHWAETGHKEVAEIRLFAFFAERNVTENGNKLFADAAEYIRVHAGDGTDAETVAARFGYSPDHLSRVFRASCGRSLKQYLDGERCGRLKDLLLDTSLTLSEVANRCGFSSADGMIRFFRYHEGVTPTAFRNARFASHTNRK